MELFRNSETEIEKKTLGPSLEIKIKKNKLFNTLRKKGYRITKQRQIIINTLLENSCYSCKEVYYKATAIDHSIGIATVYRMIRILDDIGVINNQQMFKLDCKKDSNEAEKLVVGLDDGTCRALTMEESTQILYAGLVASGYFGHQIAWVEINNKKFLIDEALKDG